MITVKPQILIPGLNQSFWKNGRLFLGFYKSLKSDFFSGCTIVGIQNKINKI
jgi:hypothetical protein